VQPPQLGRLVKSASEFTDAYAATAEPGSAASLVDARNWLKDAQRLRRRRARLGVIAPITPRTGRLSRHYLVSRHVSQQAGAVAFYSG